MLDENWETVLWFLQVTDMFKVQEKVVLGLDVLAIHADVQMSQREFTPEQYKGLREMGRAAATAMNEKLKR